MSKVIYESLEKAITAAKELCSAMDTYVKITKCQGGYELFGSGEFVMEIKEA
jgi:hypothetical protein